MSDTHGRFIWYELITTDVAAAKAFYATVVGWTYDAMDMGEMTYTIAKAGDIGMGGIADIPPPAKAMGIPPNWTSYVAVDDCDAAAAKVKSLGGSVMSEPMDIPTVGRFAIVADPAGAVIAIMDPAPMDQSRLDMPPGTPGSPAWRELYGADPTAGFDFYGQMFGWKKDDAMDMGEMGVYQLFSNQDGQVGGMMKKPDMIPVACWSYYFQVDDIEAAAERVKSAGGTVMMGPMDVPGGRVLQGRDPQGAAFALFAGVVGGS